MPATAFASLKEAVVAHTDTCSGKVIRVIFRSPDTGFSVLAIEGDRRDKQVVKGTCPNVKEGMSVAADGHWIEDKVYGRQMQATLIRVIEPTTREGIVAFLSSGLIYGVGPELAGRIVDHFGEKTIQVLDTESARLGEVKGIGAKRLTSIRESWKEQTVIRDLMVFLGEHGVSPNKATRIHRNLGEEALRIVKENPYILAHDVDGIGFITADQIALKISPELRESEHRIGAGIVYVLEEAKGQGHTCMRQPMVTNGAIKLLQVDPVMVASYLEKLITDGKLERESQESEAVIYLPSMNRHERHAAKIIRLLALAPLATPIPELEKRVAEAQVATGKTLSDSQRVGVITSLTHRVSVITGGPGTGKTTALATLLQVIKGADKKPVLCAPTGRAAKRMSEATGFEAKTLHRTLAFKPRENDFEFNEKNPLPGDFFIIDESSMLVIRGAGPIGYPGAAEVVNMRPPAYLIARGVTALHCMGDGRQSGTSGSPSILNASPEAAAGGNLALLASGDRVRVDLLRGRVDVLLDDAELVRRRARLDARGGFGYPTSQTPWQALQRATVGQLGDGAVLELAVEYQRIVASRGTPRDNH